ncbi:MAG: septum formation initiator family protein [Ignavibacteria bacterium]|nr:septum formation initiator family protein [Ignavibacteria bacterium]
MHLEDQKESVIKKILRFIKYHKLFVIVLISFSLFILFIIFNEKGLLSRAKLEKENKELIEEIQKDSLEGLNLDKEINDLKTSDKKIEQVAREKYKMSKKGEKIFQIKVDSGK